MGDVEEESGGVAFLAGWERALGGLLALAAGAEGDQKKMEVLLTGRRETGQSGAVWGREIRCRDPTITQCCVVVFPVRSFLSFLGLDRGWLPIGLPSALHACYH